MAISSANAVYDSQCGLRLWHTTLRGRAKCVVVMRSPWKTVITLSRDSDVYPSNHKRPSPILPQLHFAIQLTSRPALDRSQVQTSARRPVCTAWFYRHQTMLVPSGSTALRPGLQHPMPPPSDHACTAWFHRPQTTLVTSGPIVQKPLEQLPQLTPNVNRTALQLTGCYLTVPQFHMKQQ